MKSPTMSVVGPWSCDIDLADFSHMLTVLHAMFGKQIFQYTTIQLLLRLGEHVIILEFPESFYSSSNGDEYLHSRLV